MTRLAGVSARLVVLDRVGADADGSLASCRPSHDGATLIVLGHALLKASARAFAAGGAPGRQEPLTLRCGRSAIVLHPDGASASRARTSRSRRTAGRRRAAR